MASPSGRTSAALIVAAGLLFGTTGTSQAFAPAAAGSLSVGAVRLAVGGVLLGLIGLWTLLRRGRPVLPRWSPAALWVAIGAACVLGYQLTFFVGTRTNGVAVGTVVALGSTPAFAGLLEWRLLRRRPTGRWLVATGVAVSGVAGLAGLAGSSEQIYPWGLLASATAGACYAGFTVAMKALLTRGWGSISAITATMSLGGLTAFGVLAFTDNAWVAQPRGLAVVAWLAVMTTVVAYLLVGAGLGGLSAATTATLTLTEPATAAVLGVTVLGETLSGMQWVGIAAIVAGVLIAGTEPGPPPVLRPASATAA